MAEILAFHGWGLDRSVWQWLNQELDESIRFTCADRGYFGHPRDVDWSDSGIPKILIAHSYGLHWSPSKLIQGADHLILLSSFMRFHPEKKVKGQTSKRVMDMLFESIQKKPKKALAIFYQTAYLPSGTRRFEPDFREINTRLLLNDLAELDKSNYPLKHLFESESIHIIHGEADQVINIEMARQMNRQLVPSNKMVEVKEGGHMLQDTHPQIIAERIKQIAEL